MFVKSIQEIQANFFDPQFAKNQIELFSDDPVKEELFFKFKRSERYKGYYPQTPTDTFWKILTLLNTITGDRPSSQVQYKVLDLYVKAFEDYQIKNNTTTHPFKFSTLTRSITFTFKSSFDPFLIYLLVQLFLKNFFNPNIPVSSKLSNSKIFTLISGSQRLNPYYSRTKIFNLNEHFIINLRYQCLTNEITLEDYNKDMFDWSQKDDNLISFLPKSLSAFEGFQVYLQHFYFNDIFASLKLLEINTIQQYELTKINSFWIIKYSKGLREYSKNFWQNLFRQWSLMKKNSLYRHWLKKDLYCFKYGILKQWVTSNQDPITKREIFLRQSSYFSTSSTSPFFLFSMYRKVILTQTNECEIENYDPFYTRATTPILYAKFDFVEQFFKTYKQNPEKIKFKNYILHILKYNQKGFMKLTSEEKKLKLMNFSLTRDLYGWFEFKKPPLIIPLSVRYNRLAVTLKVLIYKKIYIIFNWQTYSIQLIGPKHKLKLIFLIASLYRQFKDTAVQSLHDDKLILLAPFLNSSKITNDKIYYSQTSTNKWVNSFPKPVKDSNKNLNYVIYTYNSKFQLLSKKLNEFTPKTEYKNLTKDTFKDITKKQKQNFLTLELFFHPKIFFEIEKMLLISSDSQILKDLNKDSSISDVYNWYVRWYSDVKNEQGLYESLITKN